MKRSAAVLFSLSLATTALAEHHNGNHSVDLKSSSFQWTGKKVVGDVHTGKVKLKDAKLDVKDGKLMGGEFVMDMKSLTVEDLKGKWASKFLKHIKSADFFEVEKYPTAKLKITKMVDKDTVEGKLVIKGKEQPVSVDFKPDGEKTYKGTMTFDRTKFGVIYGSKNFFKNLGDKVIDNEVKIDFKVALN